MREWTIEIFEGIQVLSEVTKMKDRVYLIFNRSGVQQMRKSYPHLKAGEFAVKVELVVDGKFFDGPVPSVTLKIDERNAIIPEGAIDLKAITVAEQFVEQLEDK